MRNWNVGKCGAYIYICGCIREPVLTSYSFWLQILINLCRLGGLFLGGFENKWGGMAFSLAKRSILFDLNELILFYKKFPCFGFLVWFLVFLLFVWLIFVFHL